jgi:hypothetical protein
VGLLCHVGLLRCKVESIHESRATSDFESLERWTRSDPHRTWWKNFLRDSEGTGFWHETYRMQGGIDAIYDDVPKPVGMFAFAPVTKARGGMFSARRRIAATRPDVDLPANESPSPQSLHRNSATDRQRSLMLRTPVAAGVIPV